MDVMKFMIDNFTTEFAILKNETLWLQVLNENNKPMYIITSDQHRQTYKLYEVTDNNKLIFTKHKSNNPCDFDKYIWNNSKKGR